MVIGELSWTEPNLKVNNFRSVQSMFNSKLIERRLRSSDNIRKDLNR